MDETGEEIPEISFPTWTNKELETKLTERAQERRLMKLFIRDLINPQKVLCVKPKTFSLNGHNFRNILLQGTVVGVEQKLDSVYKTWLRVHDGTASLDCMVKPNESLDELLIKIRDLEEILPGSLVAKAALMITQSARKNVESVVRYNDFELGDEVRLIGELSEYKDRRYCFIVTAIKLESADFHTDYLEGIVKLYTNTYNIK